jgi:hypothetical protein
MNSTFVVSIWMNSWCGCFLPPCGGTEAVVPSRIFGRLDQLEQDVLDVLADIACLGQCRGIGDRERHVQQPRQRLGQQRLA